MNSRTPMSSRAPKIEPDSVPPREAGAGEAHKPRIDLKVALAAAFATFYLPLGIQMPYLPLWLQHRGLDPQEIGIAIAVPLVTRLFATPVLGFLSDRVGRPRAVLTTLALMTTLTTGLLALCVDPLTIFIAAGLIAISWNPSFALLDSYASRQARAGRADYGRSRQWGSGAFLVANVLGGVVITATGAGSVVLWIVLGHLCYLLVSLTLPELPPPPRPAHHEQGRERVPLVLALGVVAVALVQASHALLYAFASVHWRAEGWSLTTIGLLWATGVAAEIVLFRFGTRLMGRFGPFQLIVLGGFAALLRFGVMAFDPPLALLFPLQLLHGFTFGATYLGMVEMVARGVSAHRSGSGQSLAAWTVNIFMSAATVASGPLWVAMGAKAFAVSAGLGLLGAVLALALRRRVGWPQPHSSGVGG
ncbi:MULTISPECIES: MFS transporter [unclassified Xanthobacter]|uniref:MFS transporter n=1 Tax=unclassified Xanthobacter TaxID=2623496 RepID=UPI001F2B7F32